MSMCKGIIRDGATGVEVEVGGGGGRVGGGDGGGHRRPGMLGLGRGVRWGY